MTGQAAPAPSSTPAPSRPAGRYGRTPSRRWVPTALLALVILTGLAFAAWVGVAEARRPVRWQEVSAVPNGENSVTVTFRVTVAARRSAVCAVRAVNSARAQVGRVDVEIGPGTGRVEVRRVDVPTSEPAVSGDVLSCAPTAG